MRRYALALQLVVLDLLRRRLRVPLASCLGNRARYSVRLRGHAVQPGLAGPRSSGPCNGHPRADTRSLRQAPVARLERALPLARRSRPRGRARKPSHPATSIAGGCQGRPSEPAATEPSRFLAPAEPPAISAAPQSSAPLHRPQPPPPLHLRPVLLRRPRRRRVRCPSSRRRLRKGSVPDGERRPQPRSHWSSSSRHASDASDPPTPPTPPTQPVPPQPQVPAEQPKDHGHRKK
jgi:hypothetical protein